MTQHSPCGYASASTAEEKLLGVNVPSPDHRWTGSVSARRRDVIATCSWTLGERSPIVRPMTTARAMVTGWLARYGVAECVGVTCAIIGAFTVRHLTGSDIAAGYGGAWGEAIGYGSVIIGRDAYTAMRAARAEGRVVTGRDAGHVATGLLTEFGPAAILDTFVTRPLAMGFGMRWLGPRIGLIAGKLAADCVFYIPVIVTYERRQRNARRAGKQ